MKLILLKLTSFVFVSTSGVHAALPTLRGSDVMVKVEASCEDGYKAGQSDVKGYWKSTGQNCDNVWELEQKANKRKKREYPSTGNWRTDSYNECARDAIDAEVKKIEKRCLENDSSQCTDLGKAAAEKVVLDNHCSPGKGQSAASYSNYKKECKKAATSICEGQIPVVANKWCPNKTLKNSKILDMQGKCKGQVNSMVPGEERVVDEVGDSEDESTFDEVVGSLASSDAGEDVEASAPRCGQDRKCGNCKQENCSDNEARQICKQRYCGLEMED